MGLLECPHPAAVVRQSNGSKKEQGRSHSVFYVLTNSKVMHIISLYPVGTYRSALCSVRWNYTGHAFQEARVTRGQLGHRPSTALPPHFCPGPSVPPVLAGSWLASYFFWQGRPQTATCIAIIVTSNTFILFETLTGKMCFIF